MEASRKAAKLASRMKHTLGPKQYDPKTIPDILKLTAWESLGQHQTYYLQDDIVATESLNPPPVKRLFAVYGVNLDTKIISFFKRHPSSYLD